MTGVFSRGGTYSPDLLKALERLDGLVDWERRGRVRGAARLMRVSADPARALLHRLGLSAPGFRSVVVTGSKGKGSVAALLAAGLSAGGGVGVFSSPHVERVNERVRVRGAPVSDAHLAGALTRALDARARTPAVAAATWFDVVTAAALAEFERERLRFAVVEVGMGGRRDATAALRAPVAVVTNVLDEHADIIGPAREDIAREKAGVIAPGATVVLGISADDPVAGVFAAEVAAQTPAARLVHVPPQPAAGLFAHNFAMASAALEPLGGALSEADARAALQRFPGRQEEFVVLEGGQEVEVLLDGGHVPSSVSCVLGEWGARGAVAVLGVGADKKASGICEAVRDAGVCHVVATATSTQDMYMQADKLASLLRDAGFDPDHISVVQCPKKAVREAVALSVSQRRGSHRVAIVGSLHLAGKVRGELRNRAGDGHSCENDAASLESRTAEASAAT